MWITASLWSLCVWLEAAFLVFQTFSECVWSLFLVRDAKVNVSFMCSSPVWLLQKWSQFEVPAPAACIIPPHYPYFISTPLPPQRFLFPHLFQNMAVQIVLWNSLEKSGAHSSFPAFPSASLKKRKKTKQQNPKRGIFCIYDKSISPKEFEVCPRKWLNPYNGECCNSWAKGRQEDAAAGTS